MRRDQFLKSMAALMAAGSLPELGLAAENFKIMLPANPGGGWDTTGRALGKAMQDAGSAMHRSASQFAVVAKDASVTGDWKAAVGALARVNQTCVACHAGFRLE